MEGGLLPLTPPLPFPFLTPSAFLLEEEEEEDGSLEDGEEEDSEDGKEEDGEEVGGCGRSEAEGP